MKAAFLGFALMLAVGASGSAAARVFILDAEAYVAPAAGPIAPVPANLSSTAGR